MNSKKFFIHGNGLNAQCAPNHFLALELAGHGKMPRDSNLYSIRALVKNLEPKIPYGAEVWGHSLGGHLALNLAVIRPDLTVVCFGMVPLNEISQIGSLMTPLPEFALFQKVDRTKEEIQAFIEYSSLGDRNIEGLLLEAALEQDPVFNSVLFSSGIESYDWKEIDKASKLKERVTFVFSENEKVYNFAAAMELPITKIVDSYQGHCPWLHDENWISSIEEKLLLTKNFLMNEMTSNISHQHP
jgi:hypothetical protein